MIKSCLGKKKKKRKRLSLFVFTGQQGKRFKTPRNPRQLEGIRKRRWSVIREEKKKMVCDLILDLFAPKKRSGVHNKEFEPKERRLKDAVICHNFLPKKRPAMAERFQRSLGGR